MNNLVCCTLLCGSQAQAWPHSICALVHGSDACRFWALDPMWLHLHTCSNKQGCGIMKGLTCVMLMHHKWEHKMQAGCYRRGNRQVLTNAQGGQRNRLGGQPPPVPV